jgi:hypothetical protein
MACLSPFRNQSRRLRVRCGSIAALICFAIVPLPAAEQAAKGTATTPVIWRAREFRMLQGATAEVLGAPQLTENRTPIAVRFGGERDGLIFPVNPIAGKEAFTIEVLFWPDATGSPAQRFVHVEDTRQNRALIETRITPERRWYLDTFLYAHPREPGLTLVDRNKLHPCDRWYWAALVFDGMTMAHFVNGVKEREGRIEFGPMGEGRTSIGVRLNQVFWFKGEIAEVRFHPQALSASALQRVTE